MKKILLPIFFFLSFSLHVFSIEQEETFTDLISGEGMLDPSLLESLVSQGDIRAINNVGLLWAKGYDGNQSFEEAFKWWKKAADQGYTVSMNNIGLLFANGNGFEKDPAKAFDWWFQSAFLGDAWAMNSVGDCYERGFGVAINYEHAYTWYLSAAQQGEPLSMFNLGNLYRQGKGVEIDRKEAFNWFEKSAFNGNPSGMLALALEYFSSPVIKTNLVESYALIILVESKKDYLDEKELTSFLTLQDKISQNINSQQIENAKKRSEQIIKIITQKKEAKEKTKT